MGQENNRKKYANEDFVEEMQEFSDIEKVDVKENADGSRTLTVITKGNNNPQTITVPKDKALLIEDSKPADSTTGAKKSIRCKIKRKKWQWRKSGVWGIEYGVWKTGGYS